MADVAKESPHVDYSSGETAAAFDGEKKNDEKQALNSQKEFMSNEITPELSKDKNTEKMAKKRRSRRGGKGNKREDASSPEQGVQLGATESNSAEVICESSATERNPVDKSSSSKSQKNRRNKRLKTVAPNRYEEEKPAQRAQGSLSAEELAFIRKIQERSSEVKTGPISLNELMGSDPAKLDGSSLLQRLIEKPLTAENVMKAALRERPPVPGFSRGYPNPNYTLRPDLLHTAMDVFRRASHSYNNGSRMRDDRGPAQRFSNRNVGGYRDDFRSDFADRLPWIPLTPMYPLDDHNQRASLTSPVSRKSPQQSSYRSYNNKTGSPVASSSAQSILTPNQKTRKPFFMPYYSGEYVSRGLAVGELVKGSLRVNQRNYEESYIDNPEGDDQLDLLILGLHDRNRALHGDVVCVRVKERSNWVVRESLYQAWRKGQLDMSHDDDGKPMTVPPVPLQSDENLIEVALGGTTEVKISKDDLVKNAPVSVDCKYDRDAMLLMGVQSELSRKAKKNAGSDPLAASLDSELKTLIDVLALHRVDTPVCVSSTPARKAPVKRALGQTTKKVSYKFLSEMPAEDWGVPDFCLQKTAEVVFIAEPKNCRAAMGHLKVMSDGNRNWALFSPMDSRMPRMMIPAEQAPQGFFERHQDFAKFIFVARMVEWQATAQFARGRLERSLGLAGDIEAESEGLLFSNDVDTREFSNEALNSLQVVAGSWSIPDVEANSRGDLRDEFMLTINKDTEDMDKAFHIKKLNNDDGNGDWEFGIHVADVCYFLKEGTELDKWAAKRGTSVSLVHKVVPMLPSILREDLCSLKAGSDRLAISVIWNINEQGQIIKQTFARTIVRVNANLSFDRAQNVLADTHDAEVFEGASVLQVKEKILQMITVAKRLSVLRDAANTLCLDCPKLKFTLDDSSKMPNEVAISKGGEVEHFLKEFELLANMSVAQKIETTFPKTALLRRQPMPKQKVVREVEELCEKIGFPLVGTSRPDLSSSLKQYSGDSVLEKTITQVLSMQLAKSMQQPQYFCIGTQMCPSSYNYYALGCSYYTHFTSPLNNYADVMVHRFLVASIGSGKAPSMSIQEIEKQAQHCNDKKTSATAVSEGSTETFFGMFVQRYGPLEERGVVVNFMETAIDVLMVKYGIVKRVYINKLDMARDPLFIEGPSPKLTLFWNSPDAVNSAVEQIVQMCSVVDVVLSALPEPTKYQAVIKMCPTKDTRTLKDLFDSKSDL